MNNVQRAICTMCVWSSRPTAFINRHADKLGGLEEHVTFDACMQTPV